MSGKWLMWDYCLAVDRYCDNDFWKKAVLLLINAPHHSTDFGSLATHITFEVASSQHKPTPQPMKQGVSANPTRAGWNAVLQLSCDADAKGDTCQ